MSSLIFTVPFLTSKNVLNEAHLVYIDFWDFDCLFLFLFFKLELSVLLFVALFFFPLERSFWNSGVLAHSYHLGLCHCFSPLNMSFEHPSSPDSDLWCHRWFFKFLPLFLIRIVHGRWPEHSLRKEGQCWPKLPLYFQCLLTVPGA